jgi:drug/metabolite transporter superfamily protein YnfA
VFGVPVKTIVELAAAALLIIGGAWLYWRRGKDDPSHGSQSAVILLVIGAILAIHGSGLLDYRPINP